MDTYIKTDDYEITIEQAGDIFFLHCQVDNFSHTIMKAIKWDFYNLLETFLEYGVDSLYAYTTDVKFCEALLPCEVIGIIELADQVHSVIEWDIKRGLECQ